MYDESRLRWGSIQMPTNEGIMLTFIVIFGIQHSSQESTFLSSCESTFLSSCGWWGVNPKNFLMVFQLGSSNSIFSGTISGPRVNFRRFTLDQFLKWCKHNCHTFQIVDCDKTNFVESGYYVKKYNSLMQKFITNYPSKNINKDMIDFFKMKRFHTEPFLYELYSKIYDFITKGVMNCLDKKVIPKEVQIIDVCLRNTRHKLFVLGEWPNYICITPKTHAIIKYSTDLHHADHSWCILNQKQIILIPEDEYGCKVLCDKEFYQAVDTPINSKMFIKTQYGLAIIAPKFIETEFTSKVDYTEWLATECFSFEAPEAFWQKNGNEI